MVPFFSTLAKDGNSSGENQQSKIRVLLILTDNNNGYFKWHCSREHIALSFSKNGVNIELEKKKKFVLTYPPLMLFVYLQTFEAALFGILSPGSESSAAEDLKRRKYSQLVANFEFVPVAVETSGIIGSADAPF